MADDRLRILTEAMGIETVTKMVDCQPVQYRRVQCSSCGAVSEVRHKIDAPPDRVRQSFEQKGWKTPKPRLWSCPDCARPRRKTEEYKKFSRPEQLEILDMNKAPIKQEHIAAAREPTAKECKAVFELAGGYFKDGKYDSGWSDRRVADELKMPPAVVAKAREEFFGPIKGDPELEAAKSDLAAILSMIKPLEQRITAIEKRICG